MEDPLTVMIDEPISSEAIIGEMVTINCTATTIAGVIALPTLTLTHPNGTNLNSTKGRFLSIMLDPVQVQDAGEYTCTGEIDLEDITSVTVQDKQNFTFECKCTKFMSFLNKICVHINFSAHPND